MSIVNFREIPEAHLSSGDQDLFELFARDFLEALGFRILEGPGRGVDRGKDLLISEPIEGTISRQEKIWLVSVKHKAHSGRSVTDIDDPDPIGRVRKFRAHGFMGFYSTLPSSGLEDTLSRMKTDVDVYVFDRGRIEQRLLSEVNLQTVFQQYFPKSCRNTSYEQAKVQILQIFYEWWGSIKEYEMSTKEIGLASQLGVLPSNPLPSKPDIAVKIEEYERVKIKIWPFLDANTRTEVTQAGTVFLGFIANIYSAQYNHEVFGDLVPQEVMRNDTIADFFMNGSFRRYTSANCEQAYKKLKSYLEN